MMDSENPLYSGAFFTSVILWGLLIPFLGTSLGAACVLFMKKSLSKTTEQCLEGFAAGVMAAASVWSLILPAVERSAGYGRLAFVPAAVGFCVGMLIFIAPDKLIRRLNITSDRTNGTAMLVPAVILHNIPEGMSVGAVLAGVTAGVPDVTAEAALLLSLGIAIQNFPEGAIISMPLYAAGRKKINALWWGVVSGMVEPIAGGITLMLSGLIVPVLPYLLSFAAGAMICVVTRELVPDMSAGKHPETPLAAFMLGFAVMMSMDVGLG